MSIVTREALAGLYPVRWVLVPDVFGPGLGCFVSGYTQAMLDSWSELSRTRGERFDTGRFKALQVAHTVAIDDRGTLLFAGPTGRPTEADLKAIVEEIPPGSLTKLIRISDALSGFGSLEEALRLGEAATPPSSASESGSEPTTSGSSSAGASTGSGGSRRRSVSSPDASGAAS